MSTPSKDARRAFSTQAVLAAEGPLVQVRLGPDGMPRGATAAARIAAPPARLWAAISNVPGYAGRVPMIHRAQMEGGRARIELKFKVALFSVGFDFVAAVEQRPETRFELVGVSGEPKGLRLGFELEPLEDGGTIVETDAEFEVMSLGWLAKYFLRHHPEIQSGIFPGVALSLLQSMRLATEGRA